MQSELGKTTLEIASTYLGEAELTGNNDGPFVENIQKWLDKGTGWMTAQPWCAAFASWCIEQASVKLGATVRLPPLGSTTDIYNWFKNKGMLLTDPAPNCIGMLKGGGGVPNKSHHHTFFVESIDGDFVNGIDGNWQNAVSRTHHAIKDCDFGPIV